MPKIDAVLADAGVSMPEIDLVVCASGPGSFTGLRIGMATAKGLCFAHSTPLVSVPTLDALAYRFWHHEGPTVAVIDARRERVYAAIYSAGRRTSDYLDIPPDSIADLVKNRGRCIVTGVDPVPVASVAAAIEDGVADPLCGDPMGASLIAVGIERFRHGELDAPDSGPLYVRLSDAEEKLSGKIAQGE